MRHEITKEELGQAFQGDIAEAFETMVQQRVYLEVLILNGRGKEELIGILSDDENYLCGFHNTSCLWDRVSNVSENGVVRHVMSEKSPFTLAVESGVLKQTFWLYDTLEDAIAHSIELQKTVNVSI